MASSIEIPLILQCIGGEAWPFTSFRSYLSLREDSVSPASIMLECPSGHEFTLEKALKRKIIPQADAESILAYARAEFPAAKQRLKDAQARGSRATPEDYIPNQEVVAKGWECVRCGIPAQWGRVQQFALCLVCRAAWSNFYTDNEAAFDVFQYATRHSPRFWVLMQEAFLAGNRIPMTAPEAEVLLQDWRKQARRESRQRRRLSA